MEEPMRVIFLMFIFLNLATLSNAQQLDLSYKNIQSSCDFEFLTSINLQLLKKLNISNNPLEETGFQKLLPFLVAMESLEFLDLKNTSIHTYGILELLKKAQQFTSLKHLDLSGNARLTPISARQIGSSLIHLKQLERLHMADLGLEEASFRDFVLALKHRMGEDGLKECPLPLRYVDFGDRFHSINYIQEFAELFPDGHRLHIHFRSCWYVAEKQKKRIHIGLNSQKPKATCLECLYPFFADQPPKSKL